MKWRLIDTLLGLAPRERLLLAVLALLIVPLGIVFGVMMPLYEARERALDRRVEAVALNIWVQERVTEAQALQSALPEDVERIQISTSDIERDLIDAGLRDTVRDLSSDSIGVIDVRFDNVRFVRLAEWLSGLDPAGGYAVSAFRIEPGDAPGNVAASLTLEPRHQ